MQQQRRQRVAAASSVRLMLYGGSLIIIAGNSLYPGWLSKQAMALEQREQDNSVPREGRILQYTDLSVMRLTPLMAVDRGTDLVICKIIIRYYVS